MAFCYSLSIENIRALLARHCTSGSHARLISIGKDPVMVGYNFLCGPSRHPSQSNWPCANINIETKWISEFERISTHIRERIDPAREPDRIGLQVAAERRLVVAEIIVAVAALGIGILAGEALVVLDRPGQRLDLAERTRVDAPDFLLRIVGHRLRAAEMIGMHVVAVGRRRRHEPYRIRHHGLLVGFPDEADGVDAIRRTRQRDQRGVATSDSNLLDFDGEPPEAGGVGWRSGRNRQQTFSS